jgi:hypothetical protein
MLSVAYAEFHLCWVSIMLTVAYAECRLCCVLLIQMVAFALVIVMPSIVMLSVLTPLQRMYNFLPKSPKKFYNYSQLDQDHHGQGVRHQGFPAAEDEGED